MVFFAVATIASARKARGLATRIQELGNDWLERLGHPRKDASARRLVEHLPAESIVTIARAAELAGVSTTAADKAVRALEGAGILTPLTEKRWGAGGRRRTSSRSWTSSSASSRRPTATTVRRGPCHGSPERHERRDRQDPDLPARRCGRQNHITQR
jgi:hypothetical protein